MRHLSLLVIILALAPAALCADAPPADEDLGNVRRKVEPPEQREEGPFSLEAKVEAKTAYFFRGYNVMDTGYIFQPEATLSLRAIEWREYSFTPYFGVWNNISEVKGHDSSIWAHWTEFDATGGVVIERGDWSLDVQWNYYVSPSDFFDSAHELGATLGYGGEIFGVKLQPHVAVFRELDDQSDDDENTYLEAGLEPEFALAEKLTLSLPLTLGMSLDGYYQGGDGHNAFFGYGSAGARPAYQLNENWSVYAGVEYVHLFADSAEAANSGDDGKVIGVVGVSFTY